MEPESRLLRIQEVAVRCSLSKSSINRLVAQGRFPLLVQVGARAVRWWSHEVEAWLAELPRSEGATR